jgi:hypothetical protein
MKDVPELKKAIRILGAEDSHLINTLDAGLNLGLAAAAVPTHGLTLALFDPKNEFISWLNRLRTEIVGRVRSAKYEDRTSLMVAAHGVIIVCSYVEVVSESRQFRIPKKAIRKKLLREQVGLLKVDVAESILRQPCPYPSHGKPYSELLAEVEDIYRAAANDVDELLPKLALWDLISETEGYEFELMLRNEIVKKALARYEINLIEVSLACPEFFYWTDFCERSNVGAALARIEKALNLSHATVADLKKSVNTLEQSLSGSVTGLSRLTAMLEAIDPVHSASLRWEELRRIYADDVARPIADAVSDTAQEVGVQFPAASSIYVNPRFRAADYTIGANPQDSSWWEKVREREEFENFLTGYLVGPIATSHPLLILGHPGAGKSMLMRLLAARLAETGHPAVRVDLRHVPADAPIYKQISAALARTLNREIEWAEMSDRSLREYPVVILDGFDELIQSSAISRSDYLEQIVEFQRTESNRGHPITVIVTSRTHVAHRARIPHGSCIVRLEPFDETQIENWLSVWNQTNNSYFVRTGLEPMNLRVLRRHMHLAMQPLLLLLLSLYDSDRNELRRRNADLGDTDLYERLLASFIRRELWKLEPGLDEDALLLRIDQELERLSIAAQAMFSRGAQYVREDELDEDFNALTGTVSGTGVARSPRLSEAALLFGRFFFVHVASSKLGSNYEMKEYSKTYEFLHSTFAEYLVARLAVNAIVNVARLKSSSERAPLYTTAANPDYTLVTALLSFHLLCVRRPVLSFTRQLLSNLGEPDRSCVRSLLIALIDDEGHDWNAGRFSSYSPRRIGITTKLSIRSINSLTILLCLDEIASIRSLFSEAPLETWKIQSATWRAVLDDESWQSFQDSVVLASGNDEDMRLEAIRSDNQSMVTSQLERLHRAGALMADGQLAAMAKLAIPFAESGIWDTRTSNRYPLAEHYSSLVLTSLRRVAHLEMERAGRDRSYAAPAQVSHSLHPWRNWERDDHDDADILVRHCCEVALVLHRSYLLEEYLSGIFAILRSWPGYVPSIATLEALSLSVRRGVRLSERSTLLLVESCRDWIARSGSRLQFTELLRAVARRTSRSSCSFDGLEIRLLLSELLDRGELPERAYVGSYLSRLNTVTYLLKGDVVSIRRVLRAISKHQEPIPGVLVHYFATLPESTLRTLPGVRPRELLVSLLGDCLRRYTEQRFDQHGTSATPKSRTRPWPYS